MELLLGLASLLGISALLQSKALPSEKDYVAALATLNNKKDDPAASLVAGKYKAFVEGDYPGGLEYLAKGSDKTLQTLAQHELDSSYTESAVQKVGMGDEWVTAAKKFPMLSTIFYDHASLWYANAYPQLDMVWRGKVKEQGTKIAASRPPGPNKKFPAGWNAEGTGQSVAVLDGTIAHAGSYSAKFPNRDPKNETTLRSATILLPSGAKTLDMSAYGRSDGTESKNDMYFVNFFDRDGALIGVGGPTLAPDTPFWIRIVAQVPVPNEASSMHIGAIKRSKQGTFWIDSMSALIDGKEVLKNGSFEDK